MKKYTRDRDGFHWVIRNDDRTIYISYGYYFYPSNDGGMFSGNRGQGVTIVYLKTTIYDTENTIIEHDIKGCSYKRDADKESRKYIKQHIKPIVKKLIKDLTI